MAVQSYDELVESFEFLEDWEERYRYVIELGKALPDFPEDRRGPETLVEGCASQVWINQRATIDNGTRRVEFDGDSDAHIVRGLIAVLHVLLSGKPASEVAALDVMAELERLDLSAHLSRQRSNGLTAMIRRVQAFAKEVAAAPLPPSED